MIGLKVHASLLRLVFGLFLIFALNLILANVAVGAGPPGPPGGGGDPPCWPPPCIPIDGGLGFLLVAGVAYGAKKTSDAMQDSR